MRYALGCARRLPLGEIYFIPVRLDDCAVPAEISEDIQYVDLYPDWDSAIDRVVAVMRRQERERGRPPAAA
jgi:hypothetical protein